MKSRLHSRLPSAVILLASLAPMFTPLATAADSLGDIIRQEGLEPFIATWGDKATNGDTAKITYEWRLDRQAISVKLVMGDRATEGMIAVDPKTGGITYTAVDNKGGVTSGVWTIADSRVILKFTYTDRNGDTTKAAITHEKADADTLRVKMNRVGDSGEIEPNDQEGFELIRLKAAAKK